MAPQLTDFKEFILDLPDGRKITVHQVVPISDDDTFKIPNPAERTEGSSVVGFLQDTDGNTIAAPNFYVGTTDTVRITNRKDQKVVITTLNDGSRKSFIPELG